MHKPHRAVGIADHVSHAEHHFHGRMVRLGRLDATLAHRPAVSMLTGCCGCCLILLCFAEQVRRVRDQRGRDHRVAGPRSLLLRSERASPPCAASLPLLPSPLVRRRAVDRQQAASTVAIVLPICLLAVPAIVVAVTFVVYRKRHRQAAGKVLRK